MEGSPASMIPVLLTFGLLMAMPNTIEKMNKEKNHCAILIGREEEERYYCQNSQAIDRLPSNGDILKNASVSSQVRFRFQSGIPVGIDHSFD